MTSWTDSIYASVEFEHVLHRPRLGRFQCGCKRSGVWRGWLGRLRCNTGVACRHALDAVHVRVRHEV
jgi:hypothetical protein